MERNGDEFATSGHGGALEGLSRHLRREIRGILGFAYEHATIGVRRSRGRSHLLTRAPNGDGVNDQLVWSWIFVLADFL